jgi:cbb3-type cytochrome oxidase subunit 3
MGLKGLMTSLGMNWIALIALVVFFCAFLGILIWTWTRPRGQMEARARLPVDDEDQEPAPEPGRTSPTAERE